MIFKLFLVVIVAIVLGGVLSLLCYGILYVLDYLLMYVTGTWGQTNLTGNKKKRLYLYMIIAAIPGIIMIFVWLAEVDRI